MLKSRAITQCARDACEEALFGLHYTPEELGAEVDEDGVVVGQVTDEPAGASLSRHRVARRDAADHPGDRPGRLPEAVAGDVREEAQQRDDRARLGEGAGPAEGPHGGAGQPPAGGRALPKLRPSLPSPPLTLKTRGRSKVEELSSRGRRGHGCTRRGDRDARGGRDRPLTTSASSRTPSPPGSRTPAGKPRWRHERDEQPASTPCASPPWKPSPTRWPPSTRRPAPRPSLSSPPSTPTRATTARPSCCPRVRRSASSPSRPRPRRSR